MRGVPALLCAAALLGGPCPALAQGGDSLGADWGPQQAQARECVRAGRCVPLRQVVAAIGRRTPGRLLDAGLEAGSDGRQIYRVRWAATDGRRLDVIVDAASGAVIR